MNDITALRTRLFDTLDALQNKDNPMEIERAKAVSDIAQVIINSAKVEVDYARATGGRTTAFIGGEDEKPKSITSTATGQVVRDGNVITHRLK